MNELSDSSVADYLGCTAEQVRIMRLHKLTCSDCANVHVSFPSIRAFHSPLCKSNRKCANCGKGMPDLACGHEVGLICFDCYNENGTPTEARSVSPTPSGITAPSKEVETK